MTVDMRTMQRALSPGENVHEADWIHLGEDEGVLWTGRPSRFTIAARLVGGVILSFVGLALWLWFGTADLPGGLRHLPILLTLAGFVYAGYVYLDWLRLLYVITDEEIYVKYGLVSRDVTQIRLSRVQNTTFEQSMIERGLQYGDVRIYTAGSGTEDLTLRSIPDPQAVTRLLTETLRDQADRHVSQGL